MSIKDLMGATPKPKYEFGADGTIASGELAGMAVDLTDLRKKSQDEFAAQQAADPGAAFAARMFGAQPQQYVDPYAAGGGIQSLKFGNDGNLYGVIGSKESQYMDMDGNQRTSTELITAPIKGWQFDTSTLQQSPYYKPPNQKGVLGLSEGVTLYDAAIEKDASSYLIKVTDPGTGYTAGWARQKLQQSIEADSVKRGAGGSRLAFGGVDPRLYTPTPDETVKR